MAMLKLGGPLRDINGKRGGNIYRYDQCGHHAQAFPRLVNKPVTALQKAQRGYFADCVAAWTPIAYTRLMWIWHWASAQHPITNKKGETMFLPARQFFFKVNMKRLALGLPIITSPLL